jgi:hypothetical protein
MLSVAYNDTLEEKIEEAFCSLKKNKEIINSSMIFSKMVGIISERYNILFSNHMKCLLEFSDDPTVVKEFVVDIINRQYGGVNENLIFKLIIFENRMLIKRKRRI